MDMLIQRLRDGRGGVEMEQRGGGGGGGGEGGGMRRGNREGHYLRGDRPYHLAG